MTDGAGKLWGASRPALLVWWLNQGVDGSQLVGDAQDGASLLQQAAQHRGLPIRLPLADLSEQLLISDELLQGDAVAVLQEPAVRYEADMQLLVLARQHGQGPARQWALMAFNNSEQPQTVTLDLPAGLRQALFSAWWGQASLQRDAGRLTMTLPPLGGGIWGAQARP